MAGFLFWKKKRTPEAEAPETNESLIADAVEVADVAAESIPYHVEPEAALEPQPTLEPEPTPDPEPEPKPEPKPELVAVELPKRSAKKGIRSLFSRVKFNPENLDELEDILIQADFGIDASMAIVEAVKDRAKKSGATSEQELKDVLAAVIAENLEREDKSLNLNDGKLPYVFLVVGVNGVGKTTTSASWQTGSAKGSGRSLSGPPTHSAPQLSSRLLPGPTAPVQR
jgi:fused signal recognition particle receptor